MPDELLEDVLERRIADLTTDLLGLQVALTHGLTKQERAYWFKRISKTLGGNIDRQIRIEEESTDAR